MTHSASTILHFAHANGLPVATYNKLFRYLPPNLDVVGIEQFGHDQQYPVNNHWTNSALEMLNYIEQRVSPTQKVIAVGHSFGAVVSYIAACMAPERFSGLIMLDPPLATGLGRYFFAMAKRSVLIDMITPAAMAETRNRRWPTDTSMVDYFAAKGLFKDVDRDCIQDYVDAVIKEQDEEYHLTFSPAIEAQIFRTIPHNLHHYAGQLACPAALVTGEQTKVCVPALRRAFIRQNKLHHMTTPGGHLFPLEQPKQTAQLITDLCHKFRLFD